MALLKIKKDIHLNAAASKAILLVFLDLSAAFDTIDHKVLLTRLSNLTKWFAIGIQGLALSWF